MQFITKSILKEIYKKRKRWCHKYDFGNLLVIGGSKLYSGSPAFNALAAYRAGVDLVTIIAPERAANIIATFSPDLITYPVKGEYFEEKHLKEVFDVISTSQFNACVIGGGLGRNKKTRKFVIKFLQEIEIPCVIDADAIYAISEKKDVLKRIFVITPHAYEFFVFSGEKVKNDVKDRIEKVKRIASFYDITILLKGYIDVIADWKDLALNKRGTQFMTVGGTGDTLAGILGALLCFGIKPFKAACAAAFINGVAGELASRKYGVGMTASDLINEIPAVLKMKS